MVSFVNGLRQNDKIKIISETITHALNSLMCPSKFWNSNSSQIISSAD